MPVQLHHEIAPVSSFFAPDYMLFGWRHAAIAGLNGEVGTISRINHNVHDNIVTYMQFEINLLLY